MKKKIRKLIKAEAEAINNIKATSSFEKAVNLIYKRVHLNKKKLICSGMGKAGQIAHNIATTLSSTGIPSVFLHPGEAQHGDLGVMQKGDVLLLVSNSGKTREIIELISLSKEINPDVKVISITQHINNELYELSDCVLLTGYTEEICPLGLTPTVSTTTMTVIGDILVVLLMEKTKFNRIDYAKRHHGGYLGSKSKSK